MLQYDIAEAFCQRVLATALGDDVLKGLEPGQQVIKIVHDELVRLLGGEEALEDTVTGHAYEPGTFDEPLFMVSPGPTIVMVCGLQGSGKTTTSGKLAAWLKGQGKNVVLAACDLQRPAAVEQLRVLAEQADAVEGEGKVGFYGEPDKCAAYGEAVGVAVDVAKTAVTHAKAEKADVLVLDTAGRLHIDDDLMGELRQVRGAVNPHNILLVIDAMTGQDAVTSAAHFNESMELDGVILTKLDSDTRGGAALTVREVTGKPIKMVGVGEKLDALQPFHPARLAGRILGMGDIVSLVEKAQAEVSEEEAQDLQDKMSKGEMTLDDFAKQMGRIRKMGSLKSLLGMLPGIGRQLKDLPLDDKQINKTLALISSMTPEERRQPKVLDNSRRRRIAKGAGQKPEDVSKLVKGFDMINQMNKQMAGGGHSMMGRLAQMGNMGPEQMAGMMRGMGGGLPEKPKSKYKKRKKRR